MKKEHLFDLLENVDDKYIEEALHDYDEYDSNSPVAVYEGKTRITPMKIIAPIAACLALVTAAGFVVSNFDKLTKSATPNNSTSNGETNSSAYMENSAPVVVKELADTAFVNKCKELVMSQLKETSSSYKTLDASDISWAAGMLDMDFDGEDEYLIYPTEKREGVFVFKKTQDEPEYIGLFGEGVEIDFNEIYKAVDGGNYYYYHYLIQDQSIYFENGYSCEGIKLVSFEQNRICETQGIYGDVVSKYYCGKHFNNALTCYDDNNNKISPDDFITLWKQYPYLPEPTITQLGISYFDINSAMNLLAKKHGISDKSKLFKNEFWYEIDINNDNIKEGVIMFKDVPELPDIYIVGDYGMKYLGSLGITGKPFYEQWRDEEGRSTFVDINLCQYEDESFFYCTTTETSTVNGEEIETAWYIYKVIVNDDNTVSGEKYLNFGRDLSNGGKVFLRLGDRDISASEFMKERNKFCKNSDYKFTELDREMIMEAGLDIGDFYKDIKEIDQELREFPKPGYNDKYVWSVRQRRATLCSVKLDDYRVSLCAENLFTGNIDGEPIYCAEKLFITLTNKDGKVIDIVDVKPQGSFFTENFNGFTPIIKENINDMLAADSDNTTFDLKFFTPDNAEKMSFSIENDKLVSNS